MYIIIEFKYKKIYVGKDFFLIINNFYKIIILK